jgi:uncharacterized membrane protein
MGGIKNWPSKSDLLFVAVLVIVSAVLVALPSPFKHDEDEGSVRAKALVLGTNNDLVIETGIIKTGEQTLKVRILNGQYRGKELKAVNHLVGRMEFDKFFVPGDKVLAVILPGANGSVVNVNVIDHYRIGTEAILLLLFALFLFLFAKWTGIKAILSFCFTGIVIWKLLLPGILKGYSPILLSLLTVTVLSFVIIFLVAGLNKKGTAAFLGAISGVAVTCVMAIIFGKLFNIHGAIKPFSETLLYSGYPYLNLTDIFLSGIFIASSGAMMDVSMDIASAQDEICRQNPGISPRGLMRSGFHIGKAVVGTMTTTLLLAYSASFSALLMVFIAQGTPMINILNLNYVSGEILHTLVGSFGLVLVAPFTAIIGAWIFPLKNTEQN